MTMRLIDFEPTVSGLDAIDTAGVSGAIDAAGGIADSNVRGSVHEVAPTPEAPTPSTENAPTPQRDEQGRFITPATPTQDAGTETEPFTPVNVNDLPPELQQIYRSLQGDYTRKTQQLAEQRKLYDQFGDPQSVAEAMQLQQQLSDPRYWPSLHQQLTEGLREAGYSPQEAHTLASGEVQRQQQEAPSSPLDALDDPDLQPVREAYKGLQSEVQQLRNELTAQREAEQAQALEMAVVGELQRQENFITQNNPHYTKDDVESIYELSTFYDGNLIQAQQRYEQMMSSRLASYLASKSGPGVSGGMSTGSTVTQPGVDKPRTLDEAHEAAMQAIRLMEAGS